ncbi:hypothetical protein PEX1_071860 [Penicillium expansum]|uniref:Uncharacterized protein n=1 Tax=Penicillium expansum TaxID=27334 RepID=A0A0A2JPN4_PENEN|nr:hypothetical protein PEX2_086330 [Penicillium expansum]KGO39903.1 hypothetical protein PEXP_032860 [Penicillium expansum]KGO55054.1 hypothetical protein PEX2_086330 [Penicillium expansum]KGO56593.1 hypothetical protein PEX1_071860 [Penicillium expansum]
MYIVPPKRQIRRWVCIYQNPTNREEKGEKVTRLSLSGALKSGSAPEMARLYLVYFHTNESWT